MELDSDSEYETDSVSTDGSVMSEAEEETKPKVAEPPVKKPKQKRKPHKKKVSEARRQQLARAREIRKQKALERKIKAQLEKEQKEKEQEQTKTKKKRRRRKKKVDVKSAGDLELNNNVEFVRKYKGKPKRLLVIDADLIEKYDMNYGEEKQLPKTEPTKPKPKKEIQAPPPKQQVNQQIYQSNPPAFLNNDEVLKNLWKQMNRRNY